MNEIILASASPRRRELLHQIGIPFRVCISDCEEIITETLPERVVCELSRQKARDVWQKLQKGQLAADTGTAAGKSGAGKSAERADANNTERVVIGADTVVAYGGRILGVS
ncbi:MAG: Maf family protein [Lachnospiraceae bacterium]|nr:Maf family protein [Lachnospiraceae bacterium]